MKILERKELSIVGNCPSCGSKLELEKGDIGWHYDIYMVVVHLMLLVQFVIMALM